MKLSSVYLVVVALLIVAGSSAMRPIALTSEGARINATALKVANGAPCSDSCGFVIVAECAIVMADCAADCVISPSHCVACITDAGMTQCCPCASETIGFDCSDC